MVRITALPGYGELRLYRVLDAFRKAYPGVVLDMELTTWMVDLSTGEFDVAIRATNDPPEYLVARDLHSNRFVLVASPEYLEQRGTPTRLADLENHAALAHRKTGAEVCSWRAQLLDGQQVPVKRNPVFITNEGILLLRAALAGEGLAFLPDWSVMDGLRGRPAQRGCAHRRSPGAPGWKGYAHGSVVRPEQGSPREGSSPCGLPCGSTEESEPQS